jgi:integrase
VDAALTDLNRPRIEAWLASLALDYPDITTRRARITALSTFLRDIHRHGWEPELSPTAWCFDDTPPRKLSKPRWISEDVMRRMEAPANLARFPSDLGRLILQILINRGVRLKDARKLPHDCVVRDDTGAAYLAWLNHKMRGRIAFFPISESLAAAITDQQQQVTQRFEHGSPWLFPGHQANLSANKSVSDTWWRDHLNRWLADIELHHNGKPIRVTAHQFRHTLGTRLINTNVPQHVVQQLLDHVSPQMTAVYARLLDKTVREHWERATKVNANGEVVDLPPITRSRTRNGCACRWFAPWSPCPTATAARPSRPTASSPTCLDCRFFLTTGDFLDQHRVVEKNIQTLIRLEKLVATLHKTGPRQIVAGGQIEDLDAAL